MTYNTTILPSHGQIVITNETIHNITGLTSNTSYMITVDAWRGDNRVHRTSLNNSTLEALGKYICIHSVLPVCIICTC